MDGQPTKEFGSLLVSLRLDKRKGNRSREMGRKRLPLFLLPPPFQNKGADRRCIKEGPYTGRTKKKRASRILLLRSICIENGKMAARRRPSVAIACFMYYMRDIFMNTTALCIVGYRLEPGTRSPFRMETKQIPNCEGKGKIAGSGSIALGRLQ